MASFSHPTVSALAPASPILQQRDLTPPAMYPCHMPLRPPPIAHHHIVNVGSVDTSTSTVSGSPTVNIGNLHDSGGSSNNSSGYEVLSAYRLPPPPLSTGSSSAITPSSALTPLSGHCSSSQMEHTAGGGFGGNSLPSSMPSYAHMSYNYSAASSVASSSNSSSVSGINSHGINSGKQQFFASCFYSPWV